MVLFGITMVVVGTINKFLVVEFGVDKFIYVIAALLLGPFTLLYLIKTSLLEKK